MAERPLDTPESQSKFFPNTPENFHLRPITRRINPFTGKLEGDDSGFSKLDVDECEEPIIEIPPDSPGIVLRPHYDGMRVEDGVFDQNLVVPGAVDESGRMFAREGLLDGLQIAARYLQDRYGPTVRIALLDTFRARKRQSSRFRQDLVLLLEGNKTPDLATLHAAGVRADGSSSWVNPDFTSAQYKTVESDLRSSGDIMRDVETIAKKDIDQQIKKNPDLFRDAAAIAKATHRKIEKVVRELITICANAADVSTHFPKPEDAIDLPIVSPDLYLSTHRMGHSTGGAVDAVLLIEGKPTSLVPFDYIGEEAGITYFEDDANLPRFREKAKTDTRIRAYLQNLGKDPDNITEDDWELAKQALRILVHTLTGIGFTYYSAHNPEEGGEYYHFNNGNFRKDPATGLLVTKGTWADKYLNDGCNCQARLTQPHDPEKGISAKGIYGGDFAHDRLGMSM